MTFPVTEPQLLYHESELKINNDFFFYFKTCFKSERVDGKNPLLGIQEEFVLFPVGLGVWVCEQGWEVG